jgi:hypothetical protein
MRACVDGGMDADVSMEGKWEQANWGLFAQSMLMALAIMYPLNSTDGGREEREERQLSRVCALEC